MLQRAGVKSEIMKSVRQRQMKFLGHVMRQQQMENLCLTGKVEGRKGREDQGPNFWTVWQSLSEEVIRRTGYFVKQRTDRSGLMVTNVIGDTAPR